MGISGCLLDKVVEEIIDVDLGLACSVDFNILRCDSWRTRRAARRIVGFRLLCCAWRRRGVVRGSAGGVMLVLRLLLLRGGLWMGRGGVRGALLWRWSARLDGG